jgi:glycosyltransferase involved in cell wall biosynthesis
VKVLLVSGIWPPDPGGPASHAPALADFLRARGHAVEAVTTAHAEPAPRGYPVHWVSRTLPTERRYARCVMLVRKHGRAADVVYATSMVRRASAGSALARRPLVVKLVSDEVFERQQREGRYAGTLDEFQDVEGVRIRLLRAARNAALRRAEHVFCPSAYLRDVALGWRLDPDRLSVLPNPAPDVPELPPREALRAELDLQRPTLAFAGRLGPQKALGVALEALAGVPDVDLVVAGDGPDPSGRGSSNGRRSSSSRRASALSARSRGAPSFASSARPTPPCSAPHGRTCRTRSSRRWRWGRR